MKESPLTLELVITGYLLAYWFLKDEQDALEATRTAAYELDSELEGQCERMKLPAEKRTKTNLEPGNLFLSLVVKATDNIAGRNLRAAGAMILSASDCLCFFLLHAVTLGREHSLPLSVAVTRIIHNYTTEITRLLYEVMLLGNDERKDSGYRGIKARQMASLKLHLKGLLREYLIKHKNNEKRFKPMVNVPESYRDLACRTLDLLTVWDDEHLPPDFAALPMDSVERLLKAQNADEAHIFDRRRMHALTERLCFETVTEAAGPTVAPARQSLDLPLLYLPDGSPTDIGDVTQGRIPDAMPAERMLNEIVNIPRNQGALRARWTGGAVTIHVDGERMETIPRGFRIALRSRHAGFTSSVGIWGDYEGQAVLLACHTFSLIDGDDDLTAAMRLADDSALNIQAIVRGTDEAPVLTLRIAYAVELDDTDPNAAGGVTRFVLVIPFTPKGAVKDIKPKSRDPSTPVS